MHNDAKINDETGKPEIIMDYNATKAGIDAVDKMCETYNVARGTNRWPMVVFYSIMNVTGINSYIIYYYMSKTIPTKKLTAGCSCINAHLRRCTVNTCLPRLIRERLIEIFKLDGPESSVKRNNNKVGRCYYCTQKNKKIARNVTVAFLASNILVWNMLLWCVLTAMLNHLT